MDLHAFYNIFFNFHILFVVKAYRKCGFVTQFTKPGKGCFWASPGTMTRGEITRNFCRFHPLFIHYPLQRVARIMNGILWSE